jgi:RNA polymerase sigma factor (sigma-70 family)
MMFQGEGFIKTMLPRFGLDKPEYVTLVRPEEVLRDVRLEAQLNPQTGEELLVIRQIGAKIYYACQSSDDRIRNLAFRWLGDYLYSGILKKVNGNKELAEDLTNNTLERVVLKLDTCRMPSSFLTWTKQIGVNQTAEFFRKTKTVTVGSEDETVPLLTRFDEQVQAITANSRLEPENIVLQRALLEILLKKIMSLKQTKRATYYKVILLGTYFENLSDQELATRLNLPVLEIQKMRHQAIKILQSDQAFIDEIR